ncbi:glutamate synthase subunit alpha [Chromatiales bacterium (ex Bugula neritina AB1)]|nr:glutamate synthase subunit alpha [Chromatiales bacterium (ex Bugula neritina AB1)]
MSKNFPASQGLYDPANEKDSCGIGFVCDIKGRASNKILRDAQRMNCCMEHRGGVGYETNTGDGAGILTALPHRLLETAVRASFDTELPQRGHYGAGVVFMPLDEAEQARCMSIVAEEIAAEGQQLIGWRDLPTAPDAADIGVAARAAMPAFMQLIIAAGTDNNSSFDQDSFERKLYLIRKRATNRLRGDNAIAASSTFYVCSLSSRIIVFKGMLTPEQLFPFYIDLQRDEFETHLAMVHSRFSTNTFPSWERAQPNRFMSHNGEINTLLGNINSMNSREGIAVSRQFGDDIKKLYPVVAPDCSDSGTFDNVLEFLLMNGRKLHEAMMLMIPEAWQHHATMTAVKRDFYEYNSCLMEPWDGPASIAFTDGNFIGAVLDRNGLRPSRYYITSDDKCIMASEVGVVDVDPSTIIEKGRLQPGRMFLIDFEKGRMIPDQEVKEEVASRLPYGEWLKNQRIELSELPSHEHQQLNTETLTERMQAFGYTTETLQFMLQPMVTELRDPVGSMGNDAALAVMSEKPRMLYDYFKQRFAQVTNPAIDAIREEVIMALRCYIGPEGNILETKEQHAHRLNIPHPILSNQELAALCNLDYRGWRSSVIDITFPAGSGKAGLAEALERINEQARQAIEDGKSLIVLSDRGINATRVPISALLAVGSVHHYLNAQHQRTRIGLVIETGEAREVHHHCLLIGFGVDAINPYLAYEALWNARAQKRLDNIDHIKSDEDIVSAYRKACGKGILKVMGKMGISTLQSYKGAQIFEIVGLAQEVVDLAFVGTASRVKGIDLEVIAEEMQRRHRKAYPAQKFTTVSPLPNPGDFHWRRHGETHMWDPASVANLQVAARTNSEDAYWKFAEHTNQMSTRNATLRGLLKFNKSVNGGPVPLDEVEPATEIVKRFATGAMSFGSISAEAHETLAVAMNRIGGKSNTGEGGEDAKRFIPMVNGDSKRSAIKQVASGRFGVTINYLSNADELQIKIIQGAKPGEGGELPGAKVDDYIAQLRHSTPGVGLISPPPHHDIYSIEDMAQLIHDLKNANPQARISVKLGSEVGVGTVAAGVTKALADHLVIAGDSGGTGASPLTSIKHAGVPWELGIAETHQTLVLNNLRSRVVLQTDGQIKTGRDVAIAALLGAEEIGLATAPLIALGCIMMRKCHLNTCPVGIATQDKELRKKFTGQPEHVVNYVFMVAKELRIIMAELGFRNFNEMVGRVDALIVDDALRHWKSKGLDLSPLLTKAEEPKDFLGSYQVHTQDHRLDIALDNQLIELAEPALKSGKKVYHELPVINTNRVVGGMLSNRVIREVGPQMLADETIHFKFNGSAGQSFGAWLAKGILLEVEGDANDFIGKGLSGGRIVIYPNKKSPFKAEDNVIAGNVILYGATSGECYLRGIVAERFCVRNSGASAVVEGVGDHGCEYMTGGRAVILGRTGRNFASGMSGGIAYVWDEDGTFSERCNQDMVDLDPLVDDKDIDEVKLLIENHLAYTGSNIASRIISTWESQISRFVKVMPKDYKRVLELSKSGASAADKEAVVA